MVLVTLPDTNEDSQGRQLRISKKLSTVCSGKRSRFSKPRPNLPSIKRGDLNAPAATCKSSKPLQEEVTEITTNENKVKTFDEESSKANLITIADETFPEDDVQNPLNTNKNIQEDSNSQNISSINTNEVILEDDIQNTVAVITDKTIQEGDVQNTIAIKINNTSSEQHILTVSIKSIDNTFQEDHNKTVLNTTINKTAQNGHNQDNTTTDVRFSQNSHEQEKIVASNTSPNFGEKSSKYPHLTSILSKKRNEPKKEAQQKRWKKFKKGAAAPERSKMTMADLIYWNPAKTNEPQKSAEIVEESSHSKDNVEEECIDDVEESNIQDSVPKLVISEDGQINIDQSSLFVSRNVPQPTITEVIRKDDTTYSSFRKRPLTKHWSPKDTANFYKALSLVGADFSLMEQIFPHRTRRELKQKFKREEKYNIDLVNRVLYESHTFDESTLNNFLSEDVDSITDVINSASEQVDDPSKTTEKSTSNKKKMTKKAKKPDFEMCDSSIEQFLGEADTEKEKNKKRRKRTKKLLSFEDVESSVFEETNCINSGGRESSKRKRSVKKLPEDFISFECIEDLVDLEDEKSLDNFQSSNLTTKKNKNEFFSSELSSVILQKNNEVEESYEVELKSGKGNLDSISNAVAKSLTPDDNPEEEYITIEYIENIDSETDAADVTLLSDVMAYEDIVTSQNPAVKRRRKVTHPVIPKRTNEHVVALKSPPPNYASYTPV